MHTVLLMKTVTIIYGHRQSGKKANSFEIEALYRRKKLTAATTTTTTTTTARTTARTTTTKKK